MGTVRLKTHSLLIDGAIGMGPATSAIRLGWKNESAARMTSKAFLEGLEEVAFFAGALGANHRG